MASHRSNGSKANGTAMNGHHHKSSLSSSVSQLSSPPIPAIAPQAPQQQHRFIFKEEHVITHPYYAEGPYRMYQCSIWPAVFSLIGYAITLSLMGISNAIANMRRPLNVEPLRDLAFEYLPHYHSNDLANTLVYGSITFTATVVLLHPRRRHLCRRLLTMWSIIYLMRATTISVTNLPDPNDMCRNGTLENGIETFFSGLSCGDMIFSGHTVALILDPLILHQAFPNMPRYLAVCMWLYIIIGMWALLATHMHYLVDIEVAVYISFLVYWGYQATVTNERWLAKYEWLAWWEHDRYYYCTIRQMYEWISWKYLGRREHMGSFDPRIGIDPSYDYLIPPSAISRRAAGSTADSSNMSSSSAVTSTPKSPIEVLSPTPPSPSVPSPPPIIKSHDDLSSSLPISSSNDSIVHTNGNGTTSSSRRSKKAH